VLKANELCPSPNLQALDIGTELGDSVNVTIKGFDRAEVGKEKQIKGRVFFEELTRPMVINRTNLNTLIELFGNDTDDWFGQHCNMYVSETAMEGKVVRCLRLRAVRAEKPLEDKASGSKTTRKTK
jgi:hypothetical protein